ncbi:MAG: hypothetical protein L3J66_00270 [Bacteroidales bacterium]|nr:hypothetical protein [Bacteroidales bacterium]
MENRIHTRQYGRFALPQFQMLGAVLLAWGVYLVWVLSLFSLPVLVAGAALATAAIGVQINFNQRLHREYVAVFGYKFGKWKKLPAIAYVTVFVEHYSQEKAVLSISSEDDFTKIKISLIAGKTERFEAGLFDDKQLALETGEKIARALKTKLLDYTGREPKWIEL